MTCSACVSHVEKAVNKLDGIDKVSVNLLTNSMQVEYDETILNEEKIVQAVTDAGYGAEPVTEPAQKGKAESRSSGSAQKRQENPAVKAAREAIEEMRRRLKWSLVFLVPLLILSMTPMFARFFGFAIPGFLQNYFYGTKTPSGWPLRNSSWLCRF